MSRFTAGLLGEHSTTGRLRNNSPSVLSARIELLVTKRKEYRRTMSNRPLIIVVLVFFIVVGCTEASTKTEPDPVVGRCADIEPLRKPLFGDTHVHTTLSHDANITGTRLGPEGAYRYARGEPVGIQPFDEEGNATRTIQRSRPLDFVVISDHADFFGTVAQCTDATAPGYDDPFCEIFRGDPVSAFAHVGGFLSAPTEDASYPSLCGSDGSICIEAGLDVWQSSIDAANAANDSSDACEFTALVGYEWTGNPMTNNLHRNVIFRGGSVPDRAVGYFDEPFIEGLWEHLRTECIEGIDGCEVLTIPHNPNLSAGQFFEPFDRNGQPIDATYANERAFMEPLVEIYQHKGESECLPGQSSSDELCGFEKLPFTNFADIALNIFRDPSPKDFIREALGEGMRLEGVLGVNPFKHGIVASTDTHIAAPGSADERSYPGHSNVGAGASSDALPPGLLDNPYNSAGGLAVVWAVENSREAIFDAMRRRETYGTSGPQIVVRFFGGWELPADMCDRPDFAETGYENGVPMGGDLSEFPGADAAPVLSVSGRRDVGTPEQPGTALQRLQVVKGWIDPAGEFQAQVFDVAGNPDNGATVNVDTCDPDAGTGGFDELCATWTDPSFDPQQPAYYYARVIENPTCRWSQYACNAAGVDCGDPATVTEGFEGCCDANVPQVVQERAWTSPIWYGPR